MNRHTYLLVAFAGLVFGSGTEVGRVPLTGEGTSTTQANLKAGEVAFWTDIDIEYDGDATLAYDVTLEQGGKPVAKTMCDPLARLATRVSWFETNIGSKHSRRGMGKLACTATVPVGGQTTANVTLKLGAKPRSILIKKADLVLKQ